MQQFIPHDYDASDHGTSSFPVSCIHRIGILDIRIFNTDRHGGNLLVRKLDSESGRFEARAELIPIDHGLCLPESLEDPYFEWIHWPQASIPLSEEELEYIRNLDPIKDAEMLRMELPMIHEASLRVLVLSTTFLKEAAAYGLCLSEIGDMMSRQFTGKEEEPSTLEVLCMEARNWVKERELLLPEADFEEDDDDDDCDADFTQFDLDSGDDAATYEASFFNKYGSIGVSCRNPLSKLTEGNEDIEEDESNEVSQDDVDACTSPVPKCTHSTSKLPVSLKGLCFSGNSKCRNGVPKNRVSAKTDYCSGYRSEYQSAGWSANEMLPPSSSFVKLSDLNAIEWSAFLEKFQELLPSMFHERKQTAACSPWLTQRLGTSCQF